MSTGGERGVIPEAEGQGRLRQGGCGESLPQRSSKWPHLTGQSGSGYSGRCIEKTRWKHRNKFAHVRKCHPPPGDTEETHLTGLKRPFGRKARKLMSKVEIGWCGG